VPDILTLLQLGLAATLLGVIGDRVHILMFAAPLHRRGVEFVLRLLSSADSDPRTSAGSAQLDALRAFASTAGTSRTHVARVLRAVLDCDEQGEHRQDALAELSFELSAEATARLRTLRVGATIASTLGLLVGIVRLRGGFAKPSGLLALEAGLTERMALSDALLSMAIGVGTSAVCFYALSLLGEAARALMAQRARVERALLDALRSPF
jgi:hypothetical protein